MKLFVVTDSPLRQTGLARIAQNCLRRWASHFERIDIWAIGFDGYTSRTDSPWLQPPFRLLPGSVEDGAWYNAERLQKIINHLNGDASDYTHVWLSHDHFPFSHSGFPRTLARLCDLRNIQSSHWVGVDCPLTESDTEIIRCVDRPVAYTKYGREMMLNALNGEAVPTGAEPSTLDPRPSTLTGVIPLGIDPSVYRPLDEDRLKIRSDLFRGWLAPEDILLLNVNMNQRRKDVVRSLELLAQLHAAGYHQFKLLMHMNEQSTGPCELHIEKVGQQLGLKPGVHWRHSADVFRGSMAKLPEADLNRIYNAADLLITTTLGEGWGLSITEALAAGCPVAVPDHTSCGEIVRTVRTLDPAAYERTLLFELETGAIALAADNSRLRHRVDLADATFKIICALHSGWFDPMRRGAATSPSFLQWLSWDGIASQWMDVFRSGKRQMAPQICVKPLPSIRRQTPWDNGFFEVPLGPGHVHFNCGCAEAPDGRTWLATRFTNAAAQNCIALHTIKRGKNETRFSHFIAEKDLLRHIEDPRLIRNPSGGFELAACTYERIEGEPFLTHQELIHLDEALQPKTSRHLEYGDNGASRGSNKGHEKNWTWFYTREGEAPVEPDLHLLYAISPLTIVAVNQAPFSPASESKTAWQHEWKHGQMRGGTPPVFMNGEWWVFFHGSLSSGASWIKRRYHMGALAFRKESGSGNQQWIVTRYTPVPLLSGSPDDPLLPWSPHVVFPSGAIWENDRKRWFVALGVNDSSAAWIRIPHADLLEKMKPVLA